MRKILVAASAALMLTACGGADNTDEANTMAADNMMLDQNTMLDANLDANATVDDTQNAMLNDLTTNDADTNLANGM